MKNNLILIAFFLTSLFVTSQDLPQLKLTKSGVESIIVEAPGIKASELYSKSLNWVEETYRDPKEVLKAKIVGKKIRINGTVKNAWSWKVMGSKVFYTINYSVDISFKDGKYKIDYVINDFYNEGVKWNIYRRFYKRNGMPKRSYNYNKAFKDVDETMNNLSKSFYNYVTGETENTEGNW
ncbi:DUF4468 domain-containing protein [Tenacibaculum finnmarkense]|uniref:DUF4468 domain-containing protein n=1 Tax=Tenacibaculum finnmarkense TaxID=2781243 RepID=UPI00187B7CF0|nr:DUF4468 domain-containing protein [Tenacibaculum finnmarkense]MBE7649256.1 DUF4468 domain-containing protein [Tenacibaculum finnmarkense genomovar ulcerans]